MPTLRMRSPLLLLFVTLSALCYFPSASDAKPVSVTLYYESMCPYCRKFITKQLHPASAAFDASVLNITIIPYGNARDKLINGVWKFHCQHGPTECLGNVIASCALDLVDYEPAEYMPFINCMELNTRHGHEFAALHKCIQVLNATETEVRNCTLSAKGGELNHQMGLLTHAAKSKYVPWILLNGQHTVSGQSKAYNNLKAVVCKLYTGSPPDACSNGQNPGSPVG